MSEFGDRLKKAFGTAKPAEIGRKLGITYQGAKNYLEGRLPAPETLIAISNSTGRSVHWLLTGDGPEMVKGGVSLEEGEHVIYFGAKEEEIIFTLAGASKRQFEDEVREQLLDHFEEKGLLTTQAGDSNIVFFGDYVPRMVSLPFLGEIAAGEPILIFERQDFIDVPDFRREKNKQYMVLRVRGDSMIDEKIYDGSLIMCEVTKTAEKGDTIVAVIDGDSATVKKYYPERGRIRLQPANPTHLPQFVTDDRLQIQGIVVGIFHKPS